MDFNCGNGKCLLINWNAHNFYEFPLEYFNKTSFFSSVIHLVAQVIERKIDVWNMKKLIEWAKVKERDIDSHKKKIEK